MDPKCEGRRWTPIADDVFAPAAAACAERSISLFMRGPRGDLLYRRRDVDSWGEVRSFGVPLARVRGSGGLVPVEWPLAACSTGPDEIHLLARGAEGDLLHGTLRGNEWDGFECVGIPAGLDGVAMGLVSAPTAGARIPFTGISLACAWEKYRVDVLARAADGKLYAASSSGSWDPARSPSNAGLPAD